MRKKHLRSKTSFILSCLLVSILFLFVNPSYSANAVDNYVWVPSWPGNSVTRINKLDLSTTVIDVGIDTISIAVDEEDVWVGSYFGNSVIRISKSNLFTSRINLGKEVDYVCVDETYVWVTHGRNNSISRINKSDSSITTIPIATAAYSIAVDETYVWVGSFYDNSITRITKSDLTQLEIPTQGITNHIAIDNSYVWVAQDFPMATIRINKSDQTPYYINNNAGGWLAVDEEIVWMAIHYMGIVRRIDKSNLTISDIDLGGSPHGISVDKDYVWVADGTYNNVIRINKSDLNMMDLVNTPSGNGTGDMTGFRYDMFFSRTIASVSPGIFWIGLKNSDDQGTQFDLKTELSINGMPIAEGKNLCITGVTRNPSYAKEVTVPFGPVSNGAYNPGDVLSVRVLTRIGTNPDGSKCSGPGGSHNNAVGLRLYYDAPSRLSRFGAGINPDPLMEYYLHSSGVNYYLNDVAPVGMAKYKDSAGLNYNNGNPWKEIGAWNMSLD